MRGEGRFPAIWLWAGLTILPLPAGAASPDDGAITFSACSQCHSVDPKETDLPGPNLFGVLCRQPASAPGFDYSPDMKTFARTHKLWTPALLDRYLADPQAMIPDSPMELPATARAPEARRAVIAFLRQNSGPAAQACPK